MNSFEYRIYYQWDGRSVSDPFALKKSSQQILEALREFPGEFSRRLNDPASEINTTVVREGDSDVRLSIRTAVSLERVNEALSATLGDWRLYGELLRK